MAEIPKHPMSLREAVEIDRALAATPDCNCTPEGLALKRRARAIVEAAVEAHEAKCARLDKGHAHNEPAMDARVGRAFQQLRALERGEDA